MIDSIGLGGFLFSFGLLCSLVFFLATFVFVKVFLKLSILWSSIIGISLGVLGFVISPYIFLILLKVGGYSL